MVTSRTVAAFLILACTACSAQLVVAAPEPVITPLLSKALPDIAGKEALMITVEYPPGAADPIHRHNAHAFIYVLEGSIVMQIRGGSGAACRVASLASRPS
jgi:quercetin dioxygenase-like cupin family protein